MGDDSLVAWWYSGFYKNRKDASQPHVLVTFRKLSGDILTDEYVQRRLPLSALGQVRLGSIWRQDRCQLQAIYSDETFSLDFTQRFWRFTSFDDAKRRKAAPPFPQDVYRLKHPNDHNWLIEFDLANGGKLLVPCIEFFARCYARSAEAKRILATYPWEGPGDTATKRFYAPLERPDEPGKWQVRLRKRLHNGDVVFLAHAKYDDYTRRIVKGINAQLEANYDPKLINPAFIRIGPWFKGMATLAVEGIRFDEGKSFLALRVLGMSDPEGELVLRSRENSNTANNPAPEGSPQAWAGAPQRVLQKYPDIVDLTGDLEPDQGAGALEIQDPTFRVLGQARRVVDVRPDQASTIAGPRGKAPDVSTVSGGDTSGDGKGVGYASIHAKPIFESNGMLRDMWDAMVHLTQTQPDVVQAVSWFTFVDGFGTASTPSLIALEPFNDDDDVTSEVRRFPYIDPTIPLLRGLLVARLSVPEGATYIVEIMRKPKKVATEDGELKDAEESFQGLVFRLQDDKSLVPWLRELMAKIRYETGVFKRLTGRCPGIAESFSHRLSSKLALDRLPCESIVISALEKLKGPKKIAGETS